MVTEKQLDEIGFVKKLDKEESTIVFTYYYNINGDLKEYNLYEKERKSFNNIEKLINDLIRSIIKTSYSEGQMDIQIKFRNLMNLWR